MRFPQTIGVALMCVPLLFTVPGVAMGAPDEQNPPAETNAPNCIEKGAEASLPLINSLPVISKEQIIQQIEASELDLQRAHVVREGQLLGELFLDAEATSPEDFELKLISSAAGHSFEITPQTLPVVEVSDTHVQYYRGIPQYVMRSFEDSTVQVGHRFKHFDWEPVYTPESGTKYTEEILSAAQLPPNAAIDAEQVGAPTPTEANDWSIYFQVGFTHPGIYRVNFGSQFLLGQDKQQVKVIRPLYFAVGNEAINYIRTQQGLAGDLLELRPEIPPYCDEIVVPDPQPEPSPKPTDNGSNPGGSNATPTNPANQGDSSSSGTTATEPNLPLLRASSTPPGPRAANPRSATPQRSEGPRTKSQAPRTKLPGPVVSAAPGIVLEQQAQPTRLDRGALDLKQFSSVALSGSAAGLILGLSLMGLSSFASRRPKR